jgi:hypothetical protein
LRCAEPRQSRCRATWQPSRYPRPSQAAVEPSVQSLSIFGQPSFTGQPIRADLQRARQIIAESGSTGLFDALKRGVALLAAAFAPLVQLLAQEPQGE